MRFVISYKKEPRQNDPKRRILISVFYVERDEKIPLRLRRGTFKSSPQILNYPVAEEKGEYTGKGEDPSEDCLWHLVLGR